MLLACQNNGSQYHDDKNIERPTWLIAPPTSSNFIYGVGSSTIDKDITSATKAALESARIEIAKVITVNISGTTSVEQYSQNNSINNQLMNNESGLNFNETIQNSVNNIELSGVVIADSFTDSANNIHYVLAKFDKRFAIEQLFTSLALLDSEIALLTIDLTTTPYQRLAQAVKMQNKFNQRAALNNKLSQLGQHKVPLDDHQRLQLNTIEQVYNSISFQVIKQSDNNFAQQLMQALTLKGFKLNEQADFIINYQLNAKEITQNNTFYHFADANIKISDENNEFKQFNAQTKGVSSNAELAKHKAIDKLVDLITQQLMNNMLTDIK